MSNLSTVADLLGDPGRATMLLKLMDGTALPAGELARIANVAPQTASGHLGKMVDGGLLRVERQGRHRYYRLRNADVGDAIEALLRLTTRRANPDERAPSHRDIPGTLAHARTCYSHLAGWLGVAITEAMVRQGTLSATGEKNFIVTETGRDWLQSIWSIPVPISQKPRIARRCLDWTERRHHLSGELGCAMYKRLLELTWIAPVRGTRAVRVTVEGKKKLWNLLRIPLG
jgi:DNA-binding transcriptional ArsR family regulator